MNNHIFAFLFVAFFSVSGLLAQTEQGTYLLGGNANVSLINTNNFNSINLNFSPNFGLFVADQFAIGITPGFSYSQIESGENFAAFNGGLFIRYYIPTGEKINPFIFGDAGYSANRPLGNNIPGIAWNRGFQGGAGAGLAIFLNRSVSLELTASYRRVSFNGPQPANIMDMRAGFQIHLPSRGE